MPTRNFVGNLVCANSLFLFSTTVKPVFLGTAWTGLTHWLSEMGYMIPLFKSIKIYVFTASCIMGLNLHCGSLVVSSFKCIRCCTIAGLIPLMSLMVHPIASFSFLKTEIKLFSCSPVKWDVIMIRRVSFSPKYAY